MKHVFIINPNAGLKNSFEEINNRIEPFKKDYDIIVHKTTGSKDATAFIKNYLIKNPLETVRFYACGGDGTLNEVVNGIVGYENASVSIYPCGSGDDFVKCIGGAKKYRDLTALLNSKNHKIDLLKVNDTYCINVCNFGFDAMVAKIANELKGKSKHPYTDGLFKALKDYLHNNITVIADGETVNPTGELLLCTLANGTYNGGKYNCAPYSKYDDGLIDVCCIKPTNVINFLSMVPSYQKGKHIESKVCKKYVTYKQAKHIEMFSKEDFQVSIDGEISTSKKFTVDVISKGINFGIIE